MERTVLITGAASGIGAATARRLAAPGTALVLTTRGNAEGLARVAEEARAKGAAVATPLADLADPGAAEALMAEARAAFGRVDQLVLSAGRAEKALPSATRRADLDRAFAVNTYPFLDLTAAALPDLRASACGRIVALSSFVVNDIGINGTAFPATAAAKAALEALARTLAWELAAEGITVNCVAPGFTRKVGGHAALPPEAWVAAARATPAGRIAEPDDIAATVAFLLSPEARHITGQVIRVDGGLSVGPARPAPG